jgi:hypothetical protein
MATHIGIPRRYGIEIEVVDVVDVTVDTVAGFLIEKVGAGSSKPQHTAATQQPA